jgi:LacI family transcriptional regulator
MNNKRPYNKRVTVRDIADKLGLSHPTVSRALNDHPRISDETKKRVREMARKMNYRPNIMARGLCNQRTSLIGLVIRDIRSSFHAEIIAGVQDILDQHGYSIILCSSSLNTEYERKHLQIVVDKQVEGIIYAPVFGDQSNADLINSFHAEGLPIVLISFSKLKVKMPCIKVNNHLGGYLATKHLIDNGHQRICYLTYSIEDARFKEPDMDENADRFRGYCRAMEEAGLSQYISLVAENTFGKDRDVALRIKEHEIKPTAAFIFSDEMAVGVMKSASAHGIKIPRDLSIVGFDDLPYASMVYPSLTTIAQPKYEIGVYAAQRIIALIEGKEALEELVLEPELVIRHSTAPLKAR